MTNQNAVKLIKSEGNVFSLDFFRNKKIELQNKSTSSPKELSTGKNQSPQAEQESKARLERIKASVDRINSLLTELSDIPSKKPKF